MKTGPFLPFSGLRLLVALAFFGLSVYLLGAYLNPANLPTATAPTPVTPTTVTGPDTSAVSDSEASNDDSVPAPPIPAPISDVAPPVADVDYFDVDMALRVLFEPDSGAALSRSVRWPAGTVTYSVSLDEAFPASFSATIDEAFAWAGSHTDLDFVRTDGPADITITSKPSGNGGRVQVAVSSSGAIASADIVLGCCLERTIFEEVLQSLGPLGDHADSRSVFSQDRSAVGPSDFDAWLLSALYSVPPGASRAALSEVLAGS